MSRLKSPPLAEVLRVDITSTASAKTSLLSFYDPDGGVFNYLHAQKVVKRAYGGFHDLRQMLASCARIKPATGRNPNKDVIQLAAPLAFDRRTRVFDLSPRGFSYGRHRVAGYRIAFFFVEDGVVKLFFLQPRKSPYLNKDQYGGMATIWQRFLLEQEFFGERTDIEIVDVSAAETGSARSVAKYSFADLSLWPPDRLTDHLSVVASAIDELERTGVPAKPKRLRPLRDPQLPLFD